MIINYTVIIIYNKKPKPNIAMRNGLFIISKILPIDREQRKIYFQAKPLLDIH